MCGPRRPGEAGLHRLGSVTLSRGLVPDLDFWVPGHRRRSEASGDYCNRPSFSRMKFIRITFESATKNRPPGTKLWRSGTKGRRRPGTTTDSVNLGHFAEGGKYESVVVV